LWWYIIKWDKLYSWERNFLIENNILLENEKLEYYYWYDDFGVVFKDNEISIYYELEPWDEWYVLDKIYIIDIDYNSIIDIEESSIEWFILKTNEEEYSDYATWIWYWNNKLKVEELLEYIRNKSPNLKKVVWLQ
jgi:hypothetical protein